MNDQAFINYMLQFYGAGGIYPQWEFSTEEIQAGLRRHLANGADFCGDSIDSEAVRDIILGWRQ
jgi:hypothetical protein